MDAATRSMQPFGGHPPPPPPPPTRPAPSRSWAASVVVGSAVAVIVLAPAVVLSRLSWHWGVKAPLCLGLVFAVGGFGGTALERMARRPHSRRQRFVEALLFYAPMLIGLKGGIDGMTPGAVISGFLMGALYAAMWAGSEDDNQTPWWWWRRRHAATREVGR